MMASLRLVDSHCHLDYLQDPEASLALALATGVSTVVVPAVSPENFDRVQALAERHAAVFYLLGLHPCYVDRLKDDSLSILKARALAARDDPKFLGIGEIGLDYFVPDLNRDRMHFIFDAQLQLAHELDKPVVLHVRAAQDQVAARLHRHGIRRGIAHAFNGSDVQANRFVKLGLKLGFGGAATFARATRLQRLFKTLPLDALVLETDSPDIAPAWLAKDQQNEPHQLKRIAQTLADQRGLSLDALAQATSQNAAAALGLPQ
ncbi:MAG: TatD family hydrolase [Burkholderiaceae bacterium]